MVAGLEVFQDLSLNGPDSKRGEFKSALIDAAVGYWSVDHERSEQIKRSAGTDRDVVIFRCTKMPNHPEATLTLWGTDEGFYVPNVLPIEVGELTFKEYNSVVQSFVDKIAAPVVERFGFTLNLTAPRQHLTNWLSEGTAEKLVRFSNNANKSTGASHPSDEQRWFAFIIAAHSEHAKLDVVNLGRWLFEVEKWDEESAYKLASDYEQARSILTYYDSYRH